MRLLLFYSLLFLACTATQRTQRQAELEEYRRALTATPDVTDARPAAERYLDLAETYARDFPTDTLRTEYLFVAADVARGLGSYERAIRLWEQVRTDPSFNKAPVALFLQGFTAETGLRDPGRAAGYYRAFLRTYPEHELAAQVRQLLSLL